MDAQRSLLLVDDDLELCALMSDFFTQQGYRTEAAHDGRDALVRLAGGGYDLIILDVMMPVLDGFEVLQQVRKRSTVPVIMLTARTAGADRVNGLNSGADDYLPKPFEPDELLARIRAVLRRTRKPDVDENRLLESGGVQLNLHTREVWLNRVPVNITTIEFDILECLIRRQAGWFRETHWPRYFTSAKPPPMNGPSMCISVICAESWSTEILA